MGILQGILGGGHSKTMPAAAAGLQLQSSTQGLPVPLLFGTNKVAPNLIWYDDFVATQVASSSGGGGKGGVGGGGGGKGGGSQGYTYTAAFQFGLCDGPILGVGNVYVNKQITTLADLGYTLFLGDYSQTAWGYLTTNHGTISTQSSTIPGSGPFTVAVNGWVSDISVVSSTGVTFTLTTGTPTLNQYAVTAGVYTFNTGNKNNNITITYNNTNATQALNYRGLAHIDNPAFAMGTSPQIPNHNVEVMGRFSNSITQEVFGERWTLDDNLPVSLQVTVNFAAEWTADVKVVDQDGNLFAAVGSNPSFNQYTVSAGVYNFSSLNEGITVNISYSASAGPDADASLIVNFLLTDSRSGAGYPSAKLGSLTNYQNYVIANGLLISPIYTSQTTTSSMINDLMTATNSAPVFSSGVLNIVPYGDQTVTANGKTYTAPSSAQYDVGDDDYAPSKGDDPVYLDRANSTDAYNSIQLECLDRSNQYNPAIVGAKDQALIDTYGLKENSITSHWFANLACGRLSAQLQLQRQATRNIYRFTLDHRYVLLDPMDLITLTASREDGTLWLNKQWVRILTIDEDVNGNFAMTAEQYDAGLGSSPLHSFQSGNGYNANYNSTPGNANVPAIFEPPIQIAQTGGLEANIACSGGSNWGGADIWISTDADSYKFAGRVHGPARQGILNGALATGSDPDTTNTLHVDLTESSGVLASGTQADADANHTLCYVDGEYISYQTATLTSSSLYDLTYLRRGQFGSTITGHSSGSQFARMDDGIFAYAFDKSQIGQTLYVKLLSFNVFGGGLQALSDVGAYMHVLTGPPVPAKVQDFQAQQQGAVVAFNWLDLVYEGGLKGYDIAYGTVGSAWGTKTFLTEAHRGTEMTNASIPPGTWDFTIRAHDIADNLGPESTVTLTVTNENQVIAKAVQETDWLGAVTGFYRHWTGVLTPLSTKTVDQYPLISHPTGGFSLTPLAGGTLPIGDLQFYRTYTDNFGEGAISFLDNESVFLGVTGYSQIVQSPAASGNATGWNCYMSTTDITGAVKQNATPIQIGSDFTVSAFVNLGAAPQINTTGWDVFDSFVPDPVTSATYIAPTIDAAIDGNVRVYATIGYGAGFGNTGSPNISMSIDTWLTAGSDLGVFQPWNIGFINMRYLRAELMYSSILQGDVCYINDFTVFIDNPDDIEDAVFTVAPGGSTFTFPSQFHTPPFVEATAIGATGLFAEVTSVTSTNCVINVYNTSDVSVGGVVNISATGQ